MSPRFRMRSDKGWHWVCHASSLGVIFILVRLPPARYPSWLRDDERYEWLFGLLSLDVGPGAGSQKLERHRRMSAAANWRHHLGMENGSIGGAAWNDQSSANCCQTVWRPRRARGAPLKYWGARVPARCKDMSEGPSDSVNRSRSPWSWADQEIQDLITQPLRAQLVGHAGNGFRQINTSYAGSEIVRMCCDTDRITLSVNGGTNVDQNKAMARSPAATQPIQRISNTRWVVVEDA